MSKIQTFLFRFWTDLNFWNPNYNKAVWFSDRNCQKSEWKRSVFGHLGLKSQTECVRLVPNISRLERSKTERAEIRMTKSLDSGVIQISGVWITAFHFTSYNKWAGPNREKVFVFCARGRVKNGSQKAGLEPFGRSKERFYAPCKWVAVFSLTNIEIVVNQN